ncbi:anti-repressor SinI family protein [Halalkalibacter sp. APA_J-10(15)]|uniref:anti-repressor SinI family protein n=1 Tax=unclassified Halalkalibacter TaxID=2893063 RepID=UPI001FF3E2B0|nr:anti-repressor SinI family protein [Halalkalibacter sp. APA_J-10(15)]MCK0470337.1 anti-repressor SinI family protein [Halalkalibacter sp. APA_J-10(15)]
MFVLPLENIKEIDQEWEQLMKEAKEIGLSPEEVRLFLKQGSKHSLTVQMIQQSNSLA